MIVKGKTFAAWISVLLSGDNGRVLEKLGEINLT